MPRYFFHSLRGRLPALFAVVLCIADVSCGGGGDPGSSGTGLKQEPVASVSIAPGTTQLLPGASTQLTAAIRDANGIALTGRAVAWLSSDLAKVIVTSAGLVTGVSIGTATVTATSEGKSGSVAITVIPPVPSGASFAIVGAQFTQGVQDSAGSIPMVLSGDAAVVNVLLQAVPASSTPMQVVLRLFNAGGALLRTDTAMTSGSIGASASYAAPTVQFLVPASVLQVGLRWQVMRDPRGLVPDETTTDDVLPRTGTQPLATVAVSPLNVRFVPIIIAANGNATPTITSTDIQEYLRTLRSIHPIGQVNAHVGASFTTSASFGTAPSGGDVSFWTQLISELDAARIADPAEPDINWFGIVAPPTGFTYTSYGGFSYIPLATTQTGPHTRTSASVRLNWFSRPTQARDLVAHELGHTFGRSHASCGGAGAPLDPAYPVAGGLLDVVGHDVYSWATGLTQSAATVATTTGDVMGYCFPVWSSAYTYKAVLAFRQPTILAAKEFATPERVRVLMIRGSIERGRSITLAPSFVLDARPALPTTDGPYRAEGLAADGRVLFSYSFEPATIDHAPNIRHFTLAIPLSDDLERLLDRVQVRGPEGEARSPQAGGTRRFAPGQIARASLSRQRATGLLAVSCADDGAQGVLVLDAESGAVLGTSAAATMQAGATSGRRLTVLCSDGIHTRLRSLVAP
jgi:hypothetical protein